MESQKRTNVQFVTEITPRETVMFTFDEEETDFTDKILSSQFRGLKKRVKKHLLTSKHIDKVTEMEEED